MCICEYKTLLSDEQPFQYQATFFLKTILQVAKQRSNVPAAPGSTAQNLSGFLYGPVAEPGIVEEATSP